jgi:predicted dehydrogenase
MDLHPLEPVRVAVVGAGHLGRIHAKLLSNRADCSLVAVCDPYAPSRAWIQENLKLPVVEHYQHLEGAIDAVVIATPTTLHHEVAKWALQQGIATFIEKPIASTVQQAQELEGLASLFQAPLQIGHVERFNPVWKAFRDHVEPQAIRRIVARREGVYTGRSTDIGIVMDLMIHDLDLILSLIPSRIADIHATGHSLLGQHEDIAVADILFENGAVAHLRASRVSTSTARFMEVHCIKNPQSPHSNPQPAWFEIDFATNSLTSVENTPGTGPGGLLADSLPPQERAKVKDELFTRWIHRNTINPHPGNAIASEHDDFFNAIRTGAEPIVNASAGCYALEIATRITNQINLNNAYDQPSVEIYPLKKTIRRAA